MGKFLQNLWDRGCQKELNSAQCVFPKHRLSSVRVGGHLTPFVILSDNALWDPLNAYPSVLSKELQWLQKPLDAPSSSSLMVFLEFSCLFVSGQS